MFSEGAEAEILQDLFCPECGYNLRGLVSARCPECGYSLEGVRAAEPRLPWAHRAERGWFKAYWRTVWMVMFRHRRFCEEMARPVDYGDAQRFRWLTVLHMYLPILLGTVLFYALWRPALPHNDATEVILAVWPVALLHPLILLFWAAATGVPSYFFHPRGIPVEQQNRAIALSYYACAALAWTPLVLVLLPAGAALVRIRQFEIVGEALILGAVLLPVGQVFAWLADLIHVGVRVMPQRKGRLVLLGATVPLLWLALALLIFVGLPVVVFYLLLVFSTLL